MARRPFPINIFNNFGFSKVIRNISLLLILAATAVLIAVILQMYWMPIVLFTAKALSFVISLNLFLLAIYKLKIDSILGYILNLGFVLKGLKRFLPLGSFFIIILSLCKNIINSLLNVLNPILVVFSPILSVFKSIRSGLGFTDNTLDLNFVDANADAEQLITVALTQTINAKLNILQIAELIDYFGKGEAGKGILLERLYLAGIRIDDDALTLDHLRIFLIMFKYPLHTDPNNLRWVNFIRDFVKPEDGEHPVASCLYSDFLNIVLKNGNLRSELVDVVPVAAAPTSDVLERLKSLFSYHVDKKNVLGPIQYILHSSLRDVVARHFFKAYKSNHIDTFLECLGKTKVQRDYLSNPFIRYSAVDQVALMNEGYTVEQIHRLREYANNYYIAKQFAYLNVYPYADHNFHEWDIPLYSVTTQKTTTNRVCSIRDHGIVCHIASPLAVLPGAPVEICINFAGTHCLENWSNNTESSPGRDSLDKVSPHLLDKIHEVISRFEEVDENGQLIPIKINIVGHSLGGALSQSFGVDILKTMIMSRNHFAENTAMLDGLKIEEALRNLNNESYSALLPRKQHILSAFEKACCPNGKYNGVLCHYNLFSRITSLQVTTCNSPGIAEKEADLSCALALALKSNAASKVYAGIQPSKPLELVCNNVKVSEDGVQRFGDAHLFNRLPSDMAQVEVIKFDNHSGFSSWDPRHWINAHMGDIFKALKLPKFSVVSNGETPFNEGPCSQIKKVETHSPCKVQEELNAGKLNLHGNHVGRALIMGVRALCKPRNNIDCSSSSAFLLRTLSV